jgi:hypothetical protein
MEGELIPLTPSGSELRSGRRMTYLAARGWLRRTGVSLGVEPCGGPVRWLQGDERQAFVANLRHSEGKDCNVAGDVVLYREAEGDFLVVEEPR